MREVQIEWKGINPTQDTKDRMQNVVQALKYLLPPDSDIRLSIEKYPKSYEGQIVVRSSLGDFAANEKNKDALVLCKDLRKMLKQQIFKIRETQQTWSRAS